MGKKKPEGESGDGKRKRPPKEPAQGRAQKRKKGNQGEVVRAQDNQAQELQAAFFNVLPFNAASEEKPPPPKLDQWALAAHLPKCHNHSCGRTLPRVKKNLPFCPLCPDKQFCSQACATRSKCATQKVSYQRVSEDKYQMLAVRDIQDGVVIMELPIVLRVPRILYERSDSGVDKVRFTCIQCGNGMVGETRGGEWVRETICMRYFSERYSSLQNVSAVTQRLTKDDLCRNCEWPVCKECRRRRLHTAECKNLIGINRERKRAKVPHPREKHPYFAMLLVGVVRAVKLIENGETMRSLLQMVKPNRPELRLSKLDKEFAREFVTNFAVYLKPIIKNMRMQEVENLAALIQCFSVPSESVYCSQDWVASLEDAFNPKIVEDYNPKGKPIQFYVTGAKFSYSCSPNSILKNTGNGALVLEALKPISQGTAINLGIFLGGRFGTVYRNHVLGPKYGKKKLQDFGAGDPINDLKVQNQRCSESLCSLCYKAPIDAEFDDLQLYAMSDKMTRFWRFKRKCHSDKCKGFATPHVPELAVSSLNRNSPVQLVLRCAGCDERVHIPEHVGKVARYNFQYAGHNGAPRSIFHVCAGFGYQGKLGFMSDVRGQLYISLISMINLFHIILIKEKLEKHSRISAQEYSKVKEICDFFLDLFEDEPLVSFKDVASAKLVRLLALILSPAKISCPFQDFKSELMESYRKWTCIPGQLYNVDHQLLLVEAICGKQDQWHPDMEMD